MENEKVLERWIVRQVRIRLAEKKGRYLRESTKFQQTAKERSLKNFCFSSLCGQYEGEMSESDRTVVQLNATYLSGHGSMRTEYV